MIRRILGVLFLLVLIAGIASATWYYRPWSKYSPYRIAEMQKPENLVTTLRSMQDYFPYKIVKKGNKVSELKSDLAPLLLEYEWNGKNKSLEQYHKDGKTTGLLVYKDGVVKHESYFLNASKDTRFTSWSVAKSFVATGIFMALKEGRLASLDDKAEKYAPQFKGSAFGSSSIKALLVMSTGINFNEKYSDPDNDIRPYLMSALVFGNNADTLLLPFKRNRPALSDFYYVSPNSQILASVLRGIYKKPLAEIISEKIWSRLGMEGDGYWNQNSEGKEGLALGYCCLNATLRDYARFGRFYLNAHKGEGLGPEVLPDGWPEILRMPASERHNPGGERYQGRGYSYHFWIPPKPEGQYFAAGVYGQYIWIDPNRNIVIVRTAADHEWSARGPETMAVLKAIARHYDD